MREERSPPLGLPQLDAACACGWSGVAAAQRTEGFSDMSTERDLLSATCMLCGLPLLRSAAGHLGTMQRMASKWAHARVG